MQALNESTFQCPMHPTFVLPTYTLPRDALALQAESAAAVQAMSEPEAQAGPAAEEHAVTALAPSSQLSTPLTDASFVASLEALGAVQAFDSLEELLVAEETRPADKPESAPEPDPAAQISFADWEHHWTRTQGFIQRAGKAKDSLEKLKQVYNACFVVCRDVMADEAMDNALKLLYHSTALQIHLRVINLGVRLRKIK